jgi:hypothetical protein
VRGNLAGRQPSRSRGTSICTGPISAITVFGRDPLRSLVPG